jgi:hypothetical protein
MSGLVITGKAIYVDAAATLIVHFDVSCYLRARARPDHDGHVPG